MRLVLFGVFIALGLSACKTKQKIVAISNQTTAGAELDARVDKPQESSLMKEITEAKSDERTIVYKTKSDVHALVPVTMNNDKTEIVAYPAPTDLFRNGKPAYPVQLAQGYWLDNRGVGLNSVFIGVTYDKYMQLSKAPTLQEIMKMISDADPIVEMYDLGPRSNYPHNETDINPIIEKGDLSKFKRLK